MFRIRNALVALATLTLVLAAAPLARAGLYTWHASCVSENWYTCCEDAAGHYNNWWFGPYPECPSFPGAADDVDVSGSAVYLTLSANVWSFYSSGVFKLYDAGLAVHTTATFDGPFEWNAGSLATGVFNINDSLELRTTGAKFIIGAILNIDGAATAAIIDPINLTLDNHALIDVKPLGLFELQSDSNIVPAVGSMVGPDGVHVSPTGTFRKILAAGISEISVPFNNDGTTQLKSGTLRLNNDYGASTGTFALDPGTVLETKNYNWNAGTAVTGDGLVRVPSSGYLDVNTGAVVTVANLELNPSGQIRGAGEIRVSNVFNWLGGAMGSPGVGATRILAGATLNLSGGDYKLLGSRTLGNAGSLIWTGAGDFNITGGDSPPILNNEATGAFDIQTDADIAPICCAFGGIINNAGLFKKTAGADVTTVTATFNNTATVEARSGTLSFYSFTQSAGATRLLGGNLGSTSGTPLAFAGGILEGTGTVAGNVNNSAGEVSPGLSPGIITLLHPYGAHNYTQGGSGSLKIEIGGPTVGTQYDRLAVGGVASLAGTLTVSLIGGYTPSIGDTFDILTALLVDGTFSTVALTGFPSTLSAEVLYSSTKVTVRIIPGLCGSCPGNINADTRLDGADVQAFVACAVSASVTGGCACADMDSNHAFDSTDWALFVAKLLADPDATCP